MFRLPGPLSEVWVQMRIPSVVWCKNKEGKQLFVLFGG